MEDHYVTLKRFVDAGKTYRRWRWVSYLFPQKRIAALKSFVDADRELSALISYCDLPPETKQEYVQVFQEVEKKVLGEKESRLIQDHRL